MSPEPELLPLDALNGLDSAVVTGFLNLPATTRHLVIEDYSARHGEAAGAWLRRAEQLWPGHRLGVSRVTLARLLAVLPEHMTQPQHLELAKSIWHSARAPTTAVLRVPPEYRNHGLLSQLIREHFFKVLPSILELPKGLKEQAAWLNDPALQTQQSFLNRLLIAERDQLLLLADQQIEVLFARRLDDLEIRSSLNIAGHKLILRTEPAIFEPDLQLRSRSEAARQWRVFDTRGFRSALIGGVIGVAVAVAAILVMFWLG